MKGEFDFIGDIRKMFPAPDGILGIGDDCAVIPQTNGKETLISTDMLVEGTHFLMDDITPYNLGWKAAASNFSDIAAMGGKPVGAFLSLALPRNLEKDWENEFLRGLRDISFEYGFPLLGGDTTASENGVCICITVVGESSSGHSLKRSSAKSGDLICVTGPLGDSAAGLEAILKSMPRNEIVNRLIERHYRPLPRIVEGMELAASEGVHAMMDISDGIGSDLRHIMKESQVGIEIDLSKIPLSTDLQKFCLINHYDPYFFAADGGEDYELLFTLAPEKERSIGVKHFVIGKVTQGDSLKWIGSGRDFKGFHHF